MKINFIINEENVDSSTDANIMSFLFKKIKDKVDIKLVNVNNFKCDKSSLNIFFGCINNVLLDYSKSNILIPNQNTFLKEWTQYLDNFDLVLVKTKYMEEIFKTYLSTDKIKYIGWRSTDLFTPIDKEYDEFLLYCYDTTFTNYQKIIDAWEEDYPTLNIVNGSMFNIKKQQENIKYCNKLTQSEFENLFNRCGVHLCLNTIDSYSHNINQCCLSKSIPLIINGGPMKELVNLDDCFHLKGKKKKLTNLLGSKYDYDVEEFKDLIKKIMNTSINTLEIISENCRTTAIKKHGISDDLFKNIFVDYLKLLRESPIVNSQEIISSELPKVTCVTLVHNRKHMFKLAIYNYQTCNYPKNKLEWLIYDTSNNEEKIEDLLPNDEERQKLNIKYHHNPEIITIGTARNNACKLAENNIIAFMDDDDYYFPQHINKRVNALVNSTKKIVGTRYLASLSINKIIFGSHRLSKKNFFERKDLLK